MHQTFVLHRFWSSSEAAYSDPSSAWAFGSVLLHLLHPEEVEDEREAGRCCVPAVSPRVLGICCLSYVL